LMAVWVLLTLAPVAAFAGLLDEEGVGSFQLLDENVGLNKKEVTHSRQQQVDLDAALTRIASLLEEKTTLQAASGVDPRHKLKPHLKLKAAHAPAMTFQQLYQGPRPVIGAAGLKRSAPNVEVPKVDAYSREIDQPEEINQASEINPDHPARGSVWSADWTADHDPNPEAPAVQPPMLESIKGFSRIPPSAIEKVVHDVKTSGNPQWDPLERKGSYMFYPSGVRQGEQVKTHMFKNPGWTGEWANSRLKNGGNGYQFAA